MTSNLIRSARRVALTVVIAGAASVAVAPAAFASPSSMPSNSNFIISPVSGDKVRDIVYCDTENVHKQHNICVDIQTDSRF
jgi:hypothetical protein